jgi:hypothetical protein
MFADKDVYVYGQPDEFSPAQCIRTDGSCDNTGSNICQVQIRQTVNNTFGISSTTGMFRTYLGTTCTIYLSDTGGEMQTVNASLTVDGSIWVLLPKQ